MKIVMNSEMNASALELAGTGQVMTLAVNFNGQPWAAPVYYVYTGRCFWFFSSPNSIHIRGALAADAAAASIYSAPGAWQDICGLQMNGKVRAADTGIMSLSAFTRYLNRFNFIDQILKVQLKKHGTRPAVNNTRDSLAEARDPASPAGGPDPATGREPHPSTGLEPHPATGLEPSVLEKVFRVKWYCFAPEQAYYTDNRIAFGHREAVELA